MDTKGTDKYMFLIIMIVAVVAAAGMILILTSGPDDVRDDAYGRVVAGLGTINPPNITVYGFNTSINSNGIIIDNISMQYRDKLEIRGMFSKFGAPYYLDYVFCTQIQENGSRQTKIIDIRKRYDLRLNLVVPCEFSRYGNEIRIMGHDSGIGKKQDQLGPEKATAGNTDQNTQATKPRSFAIHFKNIDLYDQPCTDDDGGDTFHKGTLTGGFNDCPGGVCVDECVTYDDAEYVTEHVCVDGVHMRGQARCDAGCNDGACIKSCVETDAGFDVRNKGNLTYNDTVYTDECIDMYNLTEFYCVDGRVYSQAYDCSYMNLHCGQGRCVSSYEECIPEENATIYIKARDDESGILTKAYSGSYSGASIMLGSSEDDYVLIDPMGGKVLSHSENMSRTTRSFITGMDIADQEDTQGTYIIEFDEAPTMREYVEYKQEIRSLGMDPKVTSSISSSTSDPKMKAKQRLYADAKGKYDISRMRKIAAIDARENAISSELVSKGIIAGSSDIRQRYKTSFAGMKVNGISEEDAQIIREIPGVRSVTPDSKVSAILDTSVHMVHADDVWNLTGPDGKRITGKGITIGIIDTGVDYYHKDLGGCIGAGCKVSGGYDFVNGDTDPVDDQGHGTHVAATAAGNGVLKGVAPDANIYAYKVLDDTGSGYASDIIAAIEQSIDPDGDGDPADHLDIISLSLGGNGNPDDPMSTAIDNVVDAGVVAVVAAGNDGPYPMSIASPGCADKAITVAASLDDTDIARFSSRGPTGEFTLKPDISAPGVDICAAQHDDAWSTRECIDDTHVSISGTSMATPHVAGAAALLLQSNPSLGPEQVKSILMHTSKGLKNDLIEYNTLESGAGILDVLGAVESDTIISPAHIDIIYDAQVQPVGSLTIKNDAGVQRMYKIQGASSYMFEQDVVADNLGDIPAPLCIGANDSAVLNVLFNTPSDYGFYFGNLYLEEYASCNPGEDAGPIATFSIPYSISYMRTINITILRRDFGSENWVSSGTLMLLSPTETVASERFFYSSSDPDNLIYNVQFKVMSSGPLYVFSERLSAIRFVDRHESSKTVFLGGQVPDSGNILLDEHDATPVENNFPQIADSYGLKRYIMQISPQMNDVNIWGYNYVILYSFEDKPCGYLFRNSTVYLKNDGFFKNVHISEAAKQDGKKMSETESILTLSHNIKPGDQAIYSYDASMIEESKINFYDSLNFSPYGLQYGFTEFFDEAIIIGIGTNHEDVILSEDLPRHVNLYHLPDPNIWTLAMVWVPDDNIDINQDFFYGGWLDEDYSVLHEEIPFHKGPITGEIMTYSGGHAISTYYDAGDDVPVDSRWSGYIFGPYKLFTSYDVVLPDGTIKSGRGNPFINCDYAEGSNPPIDHCMQGTYIFKWNMSDFVRNGTQYKEFVTCLDDDMYWSIGDECNG